MYKKVPIFRCTTPSTGKRLEEFEVVVGTLYQYCIMYQRRLQIPLTSSLLMVLYTEISELFCTSFRLALVSKILLKTLSECESRIGGRSPNCTGLCVCLFVSLTTRMNKIHKRSFGKRVLGTGNQQVMCCAMVGPGKVNKRDEHITIFKILLYLEISL